MATKAELRRRLIDLQEFHINIGPADEQLTNSRKINFHGNSLALTALRTTDLLSSLSYSPCPRRPG